MAQFWLKTEWTELNWAQLSCLIDKLVKRMNQFYLIPGLVQSQLKQVFESDWSETMRRFTENFKFKSLYGHNNVGQP